MSFDFFSNNNRKTEREEDSIVVREFSSNVFPFD